MGHHDNEVRDEGFPTRVIKAEDVREKQLEIKPKPAPSYKIRFRFDCGGKPPKQIICHNGGPDILEVYEEPIAREDEWEPSLFAKRLLLLINDYSS